MSALAAILFLLLLVVAVVIAFTAILGGMMGPSFNRFNPFLTRSAASPDPACGNCGYATHGISSFECPECGADLREVGIVTPGMRGSVGAGCLLPLGFTVLVFIVALVLIPILGRYIPQHETYRITETLQPNSGEYFSVQVDVESSLTTTASAPRPPGAGMSSSGTSYSTRGGAQITQYTVVWGALQPPAQVDAIRLAISPNTNATAWRDGWIEIDPQTLSYTWLDPQNQSHAGSGPLTQADMLAFLKACGADDTRQEVQDEAKELFAFVDGLSQGMHQFRFYAFDGRGGGSSYYSSASNVGWGLGYFGFWLLVWILGLILIARRSKRKAAH